MNFLETLVAEWYSYNDYFVRTNVRFGALSHGGYQGEMDVVALRPDRRELIHIEASSDARSWAKRAKEFKRKFADAEPHYRKLAGFVPKTVQRIALVSYSKRCPQAPFGPEIEHCSIPEFVGQLDDHLATKNPLKEAVPEKFALLRAIQFAAAARKL